MPSATQVIVRKRTVWLFLLVAAVMTGLGLRLLYLQGYKSGWLRENAIDQRVRNIPVEAKRGTIYDRNGKECGVSISSESVYAIPAEISNADYTAAKLAAILALDADKLTDKLKKRQAFIWVQRKIDSDKAQMIKQLNLPGVGLTQENQRYYPYENLAAHVLGFTGVDSQGLDGVELTFDSYLKGRPGSIIIEYDAHGREIPQVTHRFQPPVEGNDLYLTIDIVIQQIVERELEKVIKETQAKAVTIIVMQPQTGEILALANKPDYNPNHFADYSPKLWRNIAVSNAYEPGSTFKIVTTTAALGEKIVTLSERFFDPGEIEVQGRNIHCWKHGGHGSESFLEVVQNSCNVGFVTVGLRLGADGFYKYIDALRLGKPTGIDLPGEAKGIVIDRKVVKPINIATMAMGQSIAVTPIQLLNAACAVANDGKLLRPQIVRAVKDKTGQPVRDFQTDVINQVVDADTAREVRGILEKVVENGTGKNAFIENARIAGKTGTAQKVGAGGYMPGKYVASFVGFAPADNPQVAMLVVIDEPVGIYYGGQIAAPVFGAVMRDVLQYLKVSPLGAAGSPAPEPDKSHVTVPNVINLPVPEAINRLQKAKLSYRVAEDGERIADQIPKPDSRVPEGSSILLYTLSPRYEGEVTVPDCQGLSLEEAVNILAGVGLAVNPQGEGKSVVKQDPQAGRKVLSGTVVNLYLEQ